MLLYIDLLLGKERTSILLFIMIYNYVMENKRECTKCKETKLLSEFNWDKRFNLPFSRCKQCFNNICKEYRKSEAGKNVYKKWEKSEKGKEVRYKAMHKWRSLNAKKRNAHTAISNALRDGRIEKLPCKICGDINTEAHHESYEKERWYDVIWLCKQHHTEITYSK